MSRDRILSLNGDIQGRSRFIRNDEFRMAGQGNGYDDALAHAAGELDEEIRPHAVPGRDTNALQELDGCEIPGFLVFIPRWSIRDSPICLPMLCTGLSAVIGS